MGVDQREVVTVEHGHRNAVVGGESLGEMFGAASQVGVEGFVLADADCVFGVAVGFGLEGVPAAR